MIVESEGITVVGGSIAALVACAFAMILAAISSISPLSSLSWTRCRRAALSTGSGQLMY